MNLKFFELNSNFFLSLLFVISFYRNLLLPDKKKINEWQTYMVTYIHTLLHTDMLTPFEHNIDEMMEQRLAFARN
jgi:hypothetical protein